MISCFRSDSTTGQLTIADTLTQAEWLHVDNPTKADVEALTTDFHIPSDYLTAALNRTQPPRTEGLTPSAMDKPLMVLLQHPHRVTTDLGYLSFETVPITIIVVQQTVITVCKRPIEIVNELLLNPLPVSTANPEAFAMFLFQLIAEEFVVAADEANQDMATLQHHVTKATENMQLYQILAMQRGLVYLQDAINKNEPQLEAVERNTHYFTSAQFQELTQDVINTTQRAETSINIQRQLLDQYSQMVASVVSNNLNQIMKVLTSITIILTIPTIIGGLYGMNVSLPGAHYAQAFSVLMVVQIGLCLWVAELLRRHHYF